MKRWLSLRRSKPASDSAPAELGSSLESRVAASISDEELLRKFVLERDDRAFTLLVGRHGNLVMGVCRRVLGLQHDAEDAFQAVFLTLARKADSLRSGSSLPAWLHKTAFRIALRARSVRGKRPEQACEEMHMVPAPSLGRIACEHDQTIVDEELNALPDRYRLPLFLCCVEGKPLDVAARQLGWSVGSVKGRLERGRSELRRRLLMRKVPLALGLVLLGGLAPSAQAAPIVAPSLIAATVQAGMQSVAGYSPLGYVSQNALNLSHGSWKTMSLTTKLLVCSVAVVGIGVGAGSLVASGTGSGAAAAGIRLEASFAAPAPTAADDFDTVLALADEGGAKTGPREGTQPRTGPRDGEGVKSGLRDGQQPRTGLRDGEQAKTGIREGDRPRTSTAERTGNRNLLENFQPQTPREQALVQVILEMQRELAQLRQMVQQQGGLNRNVEGGGFRGVEGGANRGVEGGPKTGPREGGAKTGPREGER